MKCPSVLCWQWCTQQPCKKLQKEQAEWTQRLLENQEVLKSSFAVSCGCL